MSENKQIQTINPEIYEKLSKLRELEKQGIHVDESHGDLYDVYKNIQHLSKLRSSYDYDEIRFPESFNNIFDEVKLNRLLLHAAKNGVNDIIIRSNSPIMAKRNGKIYYLTDRNEIMDNTMMLQIAKKICTNTYQSSFTKSRAYDTRYNIKHLNPDRSILSQSFRVNNHQIINEGMELTLRVINDTPFLDNTIPLDISDAFRLRNGIILIVGATGTGKTSFLASNIMYLIEDKSLSKRIGTLEAPIEYDFSPIPQFQTIVTQSEVPKDIETFELGIEATLRRALDHLLIGEMRDRDTIEAGILAAATGMLIYSTLHVNRVADTIPRIISTTRDMSTTSKLIELLRLICSQDLLPAIAGGRVAVREYLVFDSKIMEILDKELHNPDKVAALTNQLVLEHGVHFQTHARFLYRNKQITEETFLGFMKGRLLSTDKDNLYRIDRRIAELQDKGNKMFNFTCDEPIAGLA